MDEKNSRGRVNLNRESMDAIICSKDVLCTKLDGGRTKDWSMTNITPVST